jgi:ABC-type transport system substrate-binding protein
VSSCLRVGLLGGFNGLDPWEAQDLAGVMVRSQCFAPLYTRVGPLLEPDRRALATGLRLDTISLEGLPRYSLRLAEDLRFCDGSLVEPEDVIASLEHVAPLTAVARMTPAANRRVQFHALAHDAPIETHLAQIWSVIGKRGPSSWLGTGPYQIVEETPANSGLVVVLERNPHWIAGSHKRPSIERIEFIAYPLDAEGKPSKLRDALEAGEVDFTPMLSRELAKGLAGVRKVYQPGHSTAFLAFVCARPWVCRAEVRRALAAAIDPWAIAQICHDNPAAFAARGLLPPALAPSQRTLPQYGLALAAQALEQLADKPTSLRMLVLWGPRPYLPDPLGVAARIASELGSLGIEIHVEQAASPAEFYKAVRRGDHDLILSGYIAESTDALEFLTALLSSKRIPEAHTPMASTTNLGGYADDEMDRLLAAAAHDPERILEVMERFDEHRPLVPLMYGASVAVHAWRVQDFEIDPSGIPNFAALSLRE